MSPDSPPFPFSDRLLSQRLERAEGRSCASFVESRAALFPASGAAWIEVAGAYAMFDTPASPVTQTFGLGVCQLPTDDEMTSVLHRPIGGDLEPAARPGGRVRVRIAREDEGDQYARLAA